MSQTARFTEVNGVLYPEASGGYPDRELAISVAKEMVEDNLISPSDDYEVNTAWYEIGGGESGMDTYFSDETLVKWKNEGVFEKMVQNGGYDAECIETRTFFLNGEDVNEDEDEE